MFFFLYKKETIESGEFLRVFCYNYISTKLSILSLVKPLRLTTKLECLSLDQWLNYANSLILFLSTPFLKALKKSFKCFKKTFF